MPSLYIVVKLTKPENCSGGLPMAAPGNWLKLGMVVPLQV